MPDSSMKRSKSNESVKFRLDSMFPFIHYHHLVHPRRASHTSQIKFGSDGEPVKRFGQIGDQVWRMREHHHRWQHEIIEEKVFKWKKVDCKFGNKPPPTWRDEKGDWLFPQLGRTSEIEDDLAPDEMPRHPMSRASTGKASLGASSMVSKPSSRYADSGYQSASETFKKSLRRRLSRLRLVPQHRVQDSKTSSRP